MKTIDVYGIGEGGELSVTWSGKEPKEGQYVHHDVVKRLLDACIAVVDTHSRNGTVSASAVQACEDAIDRAYK